MNKPQIIIVSQGTAAHVHVELIERYKPELWYYIMTCNKLTGLKQLLTRILVEMAESN
jgi:hypothetical protein